MVKVLVLGATGYLGLPIALGLRRNGHLVWGMTRSAAKSPTLAKAEIIPVVGTFDDTAYLETIEKQNIDVVVDASGSFDEVNKVISALNKLSKARLEKAKGAKVPKLGLVYVSGAWVHGSDASHTNDLAPTGLESSLAKPETAVAWRPAVEQGIISSSDVSGAIVRPALMYGGTQSAWGMYFGPILGGLGSPTVSLPANPEAMIALVHVEDCAAGVINVVEHIDIVSGGSVYPIFDLMASYESMSSIIRSAAKQLGFKGTVEFTGTKGNAFAEAMNSEINTSSCRARQLLGWSPKKVSMAAEIDIHVAGFLASLNK
ncbi:MAG: hypothetical protein M1814_003951 [Vezdaea aestivalis]|nr:MAG: hypothetical protein M1814_003951 [Vezdaea aestivalis]